jgi:hypothetical protein
MDIEDLLAQFLIPQRWSKLSECIPHEQKVPKLKFWLWTKRLKQLITRFRNNNSKDVATVWYCQPTYMRLQGWYVSIISFAINWFLEFLGAVCFLDVFITFFIGRLNEDTGSLEPAPFFQRWIIPGLMLQLLVNPRMDSVATVVAQVRDCAWM